MCRVASIVVSEIGLFAIFLVVLFVFGNAYLQPFHLTEPEIAPGEAWLLWIVRDTEPVK